MGYSCRVGQSSYLCSHMLGQVTVEYHRCDIYFPHGLEMMRMEPTIIHTDNHMLAKYSFC